MDQPEITKYGALDMQVCVPRQWTDQQVIEYANRNNLSGTESGWQLRREGDRLLAGAHERVTCKQRLGCVHIVLDA